MAASTRPRGTVSPKKTTSGLRTPPQRRHDGGSNEEKSAPSRSASPSGASAAASPSQPAFSRPSSSWTSSRAILRPQPMQVDDADAAGGLMQPVDVLSQKKLDPVFGLEARQGAMGVIRPRLAKAPPADQAPRPIATPRRGVGHEVLVSDRLRPLPGAVRVAVIGNA